MRPVAAPAPPPPPPPARSSTSSLMLAVGAWWHRRTQCLRPPHPPHPPPPPLAQSPRPNRPAPSRRVSLVLLANEALKLVQAHPLSRNVFVVLFLFALAEGHCNLDLPWGVDKLCPLYTGARAHVTHHDRFACNFAPFFAHMDALFGTSSQ